MINYIWDDHIYTIFKEIRRFIVDIIFLNIISISNAQVSLF